MNKKVILTTAALTVLATSLISAKSAAAFWPFDSFNKNSQFESQAAFSFPPIIQKIIDKFNLNPDEVKTTMDEVWKERHERREDELQQKLNQALKEGKITKEQKNKIMAKHEEIEKNREEWQNLSRKEKREKMEEFQEKMRAWAESEGINLQNIMGFGMRMRGKKFYRGFGRRMK